MQGPANVDAVRRTSTHAPIANAAAIAGSFGRAGEFLVADTVVCSYDATPANGILVVQVDFATVFKLYVPTARRRSFRLPRGLYKVADVSKRLLAILATGGAVVKGTVTITYR